MIRINLTLATLIALLCDTSAVAQLGVAHAPTGLGVGYRIEEGFGTIYAEQSQQNYLFFQGEPIKFRIEVGNWGPGDTTFVTDTPDARQLFHLRPNVPVVFSSPVKQAFGEKEIELRLERETVLKPREMLNWVMSVPSAKLKPGPYILEVRVNGAASGQSPPLREYAFVQFEVRASSAEARPEILRREALRRFGRNDFKGARRAVADLLRVHPNSSQAYSILGRIADGEGKRDEAAAHRRRADAIVRDGRDQLLLKFARGFIE